MNDIMDRLREALAASPHSDWILALASCLLAWFLVNILRVVIG